MLLKRLEVYKQLVTEQLLEDFSLDDSNEDKLIELMDKVDGLMLNDWSFKVYCCRS